MAQRYDIVKIDFQANARGANAAIESIRVKADECNEKVKRLKADLKDGIKMGAPADSLDKLRSDLAAAQKEARQFNTAYKDLVKGMRILDQGIKAFNDGSLSQMNQAFQKAVYNAAKLTRTKLDPLSDTYKRDKAELTALMDASQQYYARLQADSARVMQTIKQGGKVSRQAITEELTAHRELLQVLSQDDAGYQRTVKNIAILEQHLRAMGGDYEYVRKHITDTKKVSDETLRSMYAELEKTNAEGKVTKDIIRENAQAMKEIRTEQSRRVQSVLGGDLSKQSEGNIRTAIANAKELLSTYKTGSREAQTLSAQIVNAEEHLKTHGVEGERAARKQAEAVKLLNDKYQMMQGRMQNLTSLSASALTETQKFWQAQMDGATRGSRAYKEAERNLKAIAAEQQRQTQMQLQQQAAKIAPTKTGQYRLGGLSEQELQASINAAKQLAASMKSTDPAYKQLQQNIIRAEEHIKQFGLEAERAAQQAAAKMQMMVGRMSDLTKLSGGALEETKRFWQAQMDGAERGSTAYQQAEAHIKAIITEQERLAAAQTKTAAQDIYGNKMTMSEGAIRKAIEAAKQYQQTLAATDPEHKRLSAAIVDAEEHIKKYGIEAERTARKEMEALNEQIRKEAQLKATMEARLNSLSHLSADALAETKKFWEAQMNGATRGSQAYKDAEAALQRITKLEKLRTEASANRVLNNMGNYGDAEIRRAVEAMEKLRDAQAHGSTQWEAYNKRVQEGKRYLDEWAKTDSIIKFEGQMANLPRLSDAALAETKKFWETMVAGTEKGSAELATYEAHLQKVTQEEAERRQLQNEMAVQKLGGNLGQLSEGEIRKAIEAGNQLIKTYETASPEAQRLAEDIVRAERHLEQYGVAAERAAKKEADAIRKTADERKKTDQLMQNQLQQGTNLSQSALKAQQQYWQRLIDDPKTAASSLQQYQANLQRVNAIQQQMMRQAGTAALGFFRGDTSNASADTIKQQADALKKYRDSLPAQTHADLIKEIDGYLQKAGQSAQKAAEQTMSFKQAMQVGAQAGTGAFKGTTEQLTLAKKTLEDLSAKAVKGGLAWRRMQEALQGIELELKNVGHLSAEVQAVLNQPKGRSFNELKQAVEQGRAALANMRTTTKEEKQAFDELAKKVKEADFQMKQLAGSSKGTATAFEKAWSRLKTYVTLYVGAAVAMQKVAASMGDLMELSDKMGEVRKTTGFTADEVGRLSESLKKLDTRTSLTSLMELSAAAGQLGLKTEEDVRGFTEAANMLMVALPEMGREGATEMMKVALATGEIDKIRQQMQEGLIEGSSATAVAMTKIGSTIDQLRANSAAAAPQITDFVKRVGAVGAQSGISIDQVAALGATVDALGMRVEMSATALSRMIPAIKNNSFAIGKAIGVTQSWIDEQFKMGNGMEVFLKIFDHIREANMNADSIEQMFGGSMADIMKTLNQQGARAGIVFAGLAQGVDQLRANLGIASEAYEDNIAIMREYVKMNDTTAAKWERLKNQLEEFFVGADSSNKLGYVIDALRALVDLLTGNVSGALKMVTGLLQTFIVYWGVLKIGLGEAVMFKAAEGLKAMGAGLVNLISNTKAAIVGTKELKVLNKQLAAAQMEVKLATDATTLALAKEKVATIEAEIAQKKMNKAMIANIWFALAAAILYVGMALWDFYTKSSEADKAMAKTRAEIEKAQYRFEGYYQKLEDTSKALRTAQTEHSKLSAEVDKLRKSTDGSAEATANLKRKEDELKVSENNLTRAKNEHRSAIAEMNQIYGKYLGFLLTEENYARMAAAAHEKVALAIEREMLLKQKQAAIENVKEETSEDKQKGKIKYLDDLTRIGGLNERQVTQANKALNDFLTGKTSYNASQKTTTFSSDVWNQFKSWGLDPSRMSASKLTALWFNKYLQDTFHIDPKSAERITGMRLRQTNGKVGMAETYYTGFSSNLRANYLDTYFKEQKNVGNVSRAHDKDLAGNAENLRDATVKLTNNLIADANASIKTINTKGKSTKEVDAAYGTLANSIVGLEEQILTLDQEKDAQEILRITKLIEDTQKRTDAKRLTQARDRARASLFEQATWQGDNTPTAPDMSSIGAPSPTNPYGSYNPIKDPYTKWDADALVDRKKQMLEYVRALANGADVQSVLAKDEKFINDATKSNIKTTEQAIEWYNKERLKIQDALHAKHLTNEGQWDNPKKGGKKASKLVQDEMKYYLDELDAYYTERKAEIQEVLNDEQISEAEARNRTLAIEAEWYQRRGNLQKLYSKERKEVAEQESKAIYGILSERTGDTTDYIKADIANTIKFIEKVGKEKGQPAMDRIYGDIDLGMERSFLRSRNAIGKHMQDITNIVNKENPFNGIVEGLRKNLGTMDLLLTDITDEAKRTADREVERTMFLLEQSTRGYALTWQQLMSEMAKRGWEAWGTAIDADTQMQSRLMHQVYQVFEKVQDAIKKEASELKKQADIMWSNLLMPGGDGKTTVKDVFEQAVGRLGIEQGRVSRANSLIGAGQASERVADRLAIKQMEVQLAMQRYQYALTKKIANEKINSLREEAKLEESLGNAEKARSLRMQADNAEQALNLATKKEQTDELKLQEDIIARTEESQARLYKELREWGDLIASSLQSVFEASNTGQADFYNEIAKLRLTGDTGGGTYVVIDNAGTSDATAHYETYATEEEHLRRQLEIDQQNAVAEAWKKVMDDINQKMNDMITDQLNAMLQNASLDSNTTAINLETEALKLNTDATNQLSAQLAQGITVNGTGDGTPAEAPTDGGSGISPQAQQTINDSDAVTQAVTANKQKEVQTATEGDKKMVKSSKASFAAMTAAANMYGIAYQAMSNENLSTAQKVEMMIVQAAGQAMISMLTASLAADTAETASHAPSWISKTLKELGPIGGPVAVGVFTALIGGLMGLAASKVAKSKSEIAQATGVGGGASAGKLTTGMLTYAEGNVNEFTDPATLTPGRQYNVDAADGRTYRARYMGSNPRTHLTNGPEFHLSGERGREMIIDAGTTRQITMNEGEIWHAIQTLSGGGSLRALRSQNRRRGVRAFADGNIEDFEDGSVFGDSIADSDFGMSMEQAAALQASIDRQSDLLADLRANGIKAHFDVYGKGGLIDSYDTGKKTVNRHGERY